MKVVRLSIITACIVLATVVAKAEDSYLSYVKNAPEFQAVSQDPVMMTKTWDTWIYMPWRFKWTIGIGDEGGQFSKDHGFNGAFADYSASAAELAWFKKWDLLFYTDHVAGKGDLLVHSAKSAEWKACMRKPRTIRFGGKGPRPLNEATFNRLAATITKNVNKLKVSDQRAAYALDDEVSWGSFVKVLPWRLYEDDADYKAWLATYHPSATAQYVSPDAALSQLNKSIKDIDFSPFLDRMTFNDSYWANYLGRLVEVSNKADPDTPCGFVGGQSPNLFGGYDYAKLMKKVQFIEAYNLGSSQAVIRSFNPKNSMPQVTTHFHSDERGTVNDIWQMWYYLAHGNRGMIGWVEKWFDGKTPRPWLDELKATNLEMAKQGKKVVGSTWMHDGVGIYYSHSSIQVSWVLDTQCHGSTWINRNNDFKLGTSHNVRKAWENLLTDSGIQYSFVPYNEVIVNGVPKEYKVIILPACYALSDIELQRFKEFAAKGGTVIADFGTALFDQYGKGRTGAKVNDLFATKRTGNEKNTDIFAQKLWVETHQDKGFSYKKYTQLFATLSPKLEGDYAIAENSLSTHNTKQVGKGKTIFLNLSPQRYLQYREEGVASDKQRAVFMKYVTAAGVKAPFTITDKNGKRPYNCEITYWKQGRKVTCFIVQNAAVSGNSLGGGGVEGLKALTQKIKVTLPGKTRSCVNERTGKKLGSGKTFLFDFNSAEAVMFSFDM